MKKPLVSVIIPNYNHASYLQKRIESVLNQTLKDIELIIMDDCSTDNSLQIIDQYKSDSRISHIILNEENSGTPFIQWEKGLALAEGDIIWIAESDDYADIKFLEILIPLFSEKIGLVYCDSNVIDVDNVIHYDFYKHFRNDRFKTNKWNSDYVMDGITELRENLFYECTINNMSATLFKKELVKKVDIEFLKSFKYCGDWFFLVSLALKTQIAYHKTPLNYFKYGTDNFKKGTRSILNYFRERFMVRYFFWSNLSHNFSFKEKQILYQEMGVEMRMQINEMIKGDSSIKKTISSFNELSRLNDQLFKKQIGSALKGYIWKS